MENRYVQDVSERKRIVSLVSLLLLPLLLLKIRNPEWRK